MEAVDGAWSVIPAENLVAAFAGNEDGTLLASVGDAAEARVMLEALETGSTDWCCDERSERSARVGRDDARILWW